MQGCHAMKNNFLSSKTFYYISAGLLLLFCLFTRLWRLDTLPSGLHLDEAGMAYDAWCLSHFGVDRYQTSWPLYLYNYGGGQSILYAYLTAGLFRIFGFSIKILRLPSVIFSCLSVLYGMKICRKIFKDAYLYSLICGVLLTICPALVLMGRLGIDCYLMLGASAVFLYYFICAVENGKTLSYLIAGITGGILLYSYVLSYVVLPLFFLFALCYIIYQKKFSLHGWICMAVPVAIFAFPLILEQFINIFGWNEIKLGVFTLIKLNGYRISEFRFFNISYLKDLLRNIFTFSDFAYCSSPHFPNLYWLSIPLCFIGFLDCCKDFVISFRKRMWDAQTFVFVWLVIIFLLFCHLPSNGYRIGCIYLGIIYFITKGMHYIVFYLKKKTTTPVFTSGIMVCFAVFYFINFLLFGRYYYLGTYVQETYPLTHFDILVTDALKFIDENPEYGPKGVQMAEPAVYYALSTLESPYELPFSKEENFYFHDNYIHCSYLGEPEDGYFYIVNNTFGEYANLLRDAGFTENVYIGYSLFYKK